MFGLDAGLTACLVVALQTFVLERLDHLQSIACCASRNNRRILVFCSEIKKGHVRGPSIHIGSGGSLQTLSSNGYSAGYSCELATLEDGQSAAVCALTTLGAGCCIACQRS
jgi:hypothetical protein